MAEFSLIPHYVTPKRVYPVHLTRSEVPGKKEALLLDTNPETTYELLFKAQTQAQYEELLAHYDGQYGSYATFTWSSVPLQINDGISMTVRYAEENPFEASPREAGLWEIRVRFEVVVS